MQNQEIMSQKLLYLFRALLCLLSLAMLTSCSEQNIRIRQLTTEVVSTDQTSYPIEKALYLPSLKEWVIWEKSSNYIHLRTEGRDNNVIGGLGYDKINFQRLSDIQVAPEGGFYALDSMQKVLRKFDEKGKWLTDLDIGSLTDPSRFAVSRDLTFYVFDRSNRELISFSQTPSQQSFRFGKFLVQHPQNVCLSDTYLSVYDDADSVSLFFDRLGQYLGNTPGLLVMDKWGQRFQVKDRVLSWMDQKQVLQVVPFVVKRMQLIDSYLLLSGEYDMLVVRINYEME